MKRFRLGEPFEIWGVWWLPSSPKDRLTGKLSSQLGNLELKLLGNFDDIDVNMRRLVVPVIHGVGDVTEFTLWRAVQGTATFKPPGCIEQTFRRMRVLAGGHFDNEIKERFSAIEFEAAQIGPWSTCQPVEQSIQDTQGKTTVKFEMRAERSRRFGPIANGNTYEFGSELKTRNEPYVTYGFDSAPTARINFASPQSCADAIAHVEKMTDFLTLMVGEEVEQQVIRLYVPEARSEISFLYEFRPPRQRKLIDEQEILVPLPLHDDLTPILNKWHQEQIRMADTVALLCDVLDPDPPASHIQLLLLAQALEAFHRNVIGGEYLSKEEYEPTRKTLVGAIPASIKGDHRSSLDSRLKFGNELSLRTRLRQLFEPLDDNVFSNLNTDRKAFIGDLVEARNDFTHWVQEREQARPNGAHLENLLKSALALTQLIVLRHLGVGVDRVVSRMKNAPWRYLRRFEPIKDS